MKNSIADLWHFSLSPAGQHTLQEQLHDQIRDQILSGTIKPDIKMPSSRMLASRLGIGRNTVVYAYEQLVAEGYLETRKGAGTFSCHKVPDEFLNAGEPAYSSPLPSGNTASSNLHSGMAALDQFPHEIWTKYTNKAWRKVTKQQLHHDDPMGYYPLRQNIAEYLQASRNIKCNHEQIMIVSGLQQGLFILSKSLLHSDDQIILEDPGYYGLVASAQASGFPIHNLPIDTSGATLPKQTKGLLVTSPSRQYPHGYTMPHGRRAELLKWAYETESLILEDDYDSEFRYSGRPLNSMQGLDGGKRVIYGGTFSKTIFPAFRLGYLVIPKHLIEPVLTFRKAIDSYPGLVNQLSLHAFMESGEFARHIRKLRKIHGRRQKTFIELFTKHLGDLFALLPSDGGLHLVATPHSTVLGKDTRWCELAHNAAIGAAPLSQCFRATSKKHGMLLGFADIPDIDLEERLKKFSNTIRSETDY
ncbi:PLP-dependent aminotransferase family protein [Kordiimonas sp. SCSIO 12603]|uniref:MocR-like pyridoxine biosynthesis transcription factor PdxR n=1 Tax=Kordiimonas sp. SCSIO 12603 TaxID=2829596 RepID=UPI002107CF79|nr:PLP-dependent aminotransferase family protein [Kordiimonas sp. SCSIO 12603]UTW58603.1 PLP-dependent aminotransferase family protein [Kordiimonas sp. SCSIO 12603]